MINSTFCIPTYFLEVTRNLKMHLVEGDSHKLVKLLKNLTGKSIKNMQNCEIFGKIHRVEYFKKCFKIRGTDEN